MPMTPEHRLDVPSRSSSTEPGTRGSSSTAASGGSGGLDPRFSTCTEAKSHGYGPYYQGRDTEYGWYPDADSDSIVCE